MSQYGSYFDLLVSVDIPTFRERIWRMKAEVGVLADLTLAIIIRVVSLGLVREPPRNDSGRRHA